MQSLRGPTNGQNWHKASGYPRPKIWTRWECYAQCSPDCFSYGGTIRTSLVGCPGYRDLRVSEAAHGPCRRDRATSSTFHIGSFEHTFVPIFRIPRHVRELPTLLPPKHRVSLYRTCRTPQKRSSSSSPRIITAEKCASPAAAACCTRGIDSAEHEPQPRTPKARSLSAVRSCDRYRLARLSPSILPYTLPTPTPSSTHHFQSQQVAAPSRRALAVNS